jgi:hypothetical protein
MEAPGHSGHNHPFLLCGRAGGAINAGVHVNGNRDNMAKVHFACLRAMDVPVTAFGDPDPNKVAKEPLPGILA